MAFPTGLADGCKEVLRNASTLWDALCCLPYCVVDYVMVVTSTEVICILDSLAAMDVFLNYHLFQGLTYAMVSLPYCLILRDIVTGSQVICIIDFLALSKGFLNHRLLLVRTTIHEVALLGVRFVIAITCIADTT